MTKVLLLFLTAAVTAVSLLNFVRAPDSKAAWMTALAVAEFGHWLLLLPLALGILGLFLVEGWWRWVTIGLSVLAVVGLLRPAFSASRMEPGFSWGRLYWHSSPPRVRVQTEVYARQDGEELKLDLYLPTVMPGASLSRPGMVIIHGGGWDSGDNTQLTEWNQRWAARGWVVAAINYRLAPAHPWPAQRDDVVAAIAWLKAHEARLGLDAHRLVVLGRSAGGQIATAVVYGAHDPDIRGVIALYSPHDMPFAWSVSREDDALNSIKLMRQYLGGPPDTAERSARYGSASGQLLADKTSPPTLLLHGYPDRLVWYRHSRRLVAHLRELGVPVTHIELPWATHAFDFNPDGPGGQVADAAINTFLARVSQ